MFRHRVGKALAKAGLTAIALLLIQTAAFAQQACTSCGTGDAPGTMGTCATGTCATGTCATGHCQRFCCPPVLKWCMEGAPRICFQHGCAKPVCCPCEAPNWGYYQKCWTPWPWPPDWSHCPVPPPASQVFPGMIPASQAVNLPDATGPAPRRLDTRPAL